MDVRRFGIKDLIGDILALTRNNVFVVLLAIAGIAAVYALVDMVVGENASSLVSLFVTTVAQYHFAARLLADRLPTGTRRARYGAIFVSGFFGGLGILFGAVLLVVPGLYLLAAWSAATPFIVVEEMGGIAALGASWRATERSRWSITFMFALGCLAMLAVAVAAALVINLTSLARSPVETAFTGIFSGTLNVANWVLGISVYRLAVPSDELEEIFA